MKVFQKLEKRSIKVKKKERNYQKSIRPSNPNEMKKKKKRRKNCSIILEKEKSANNEENRCA